MTTSPVRFVPRLGATPDEHGTSFRVWAPATQLVEVVLFPEGGAPADGPTAVRPMQRDDQGFCVARIDGIGPGTRYAYRLNGRGPFPDPASRWQPDGVHGPSMVIDWTAFAWTDHGWTGVPLERTVLYELHVGTFTPEGTFAAAAARLPELADLGITAVELMPIGDFPGARNWGYDGAAPFAPARVYGTPDDLRRFVDRAHALGLAVHLDVVYNHLGPDGAYQATFNPHFYSTSHSNPWGAGINFDGPHAASVREYFIENALRWVHEYHIDGLRLDATHAIADDSARHFIAELKQRIDRSLEGTGRLVLVVAEDERNLNTIVRRPDEGGWGLDAVWADDLHHQLRVALAGDRDGYYADYDGSAEAIAETARRGWFYRGQRSPRTGRPRGTDSAGIPLDRFIVCLQNHDQVGNRAFGERLHHQIPVAAWRGASTFLLALPETPLLFMGQEWAATSPFLYFTDHHDELGRQVTEGRRREFARFAAFGDPGRIPDPQDPATFERSRLDWAERTREPHASTLRLYRRLLELRRTSPAMRAGRPFQVEAAGHDGLVVRRDDGEGALLFVVRLREAGPVVPGAIADPGAGLRWNTLLTTEDDWLGLADTAPPIVESDGRVVFQRPGAVVLTAESAESGR